MRVDNKNRLLEETVSLGGYFYVRASLCSLHGLGIYGVRVVFSMCVCHLFPQCMLALSH